MHAADQDGIPLGAPRQPAGSSRDRAPIVVLALAADPDLRTYVRRCLASFPRPVRVIEAARMAEAEPWILQRPPALVIADVVEAEPGEEELVTTLAEATQDQPIATLLLVDDGIAASAVGHRDVLVKPFNARRLCSAVERLLGTDT